MSGADEGTTLRPAVPADLPVIFRAERDYIKDIEPGQEAAWTEAIDRNLELWIANLDRTTMLLAGAGTAGFVMWTPDPAYRADAATLVTIQVRPECRRRGYGRTLLGVFAEQGTKAGYRLLHLGVHKDNPARALNRVAALIGDLGGRTAVLGGLDAARQAEEAAGFVMRLVAAGANPRLAVPDVNPEPLRAAAADQ